MLKTFWFGSLPFIPVYGCGHLQACARGAICERGFGQYFSRFSQGRLSRQNFEQRADARFISDIGNSKSLLGLGNRVFLEVQSVLRLAQTVVSFLNFESNVISPLLQVKGRLVMFGDSLGNGAADPPTLEDGYCQTQSCGPGLASG